LSHRPSVWKVRLLRPPIAWFSTAIFSGSKSLKYGVAPTLLPFGADLDGRIADEEESGFVRDGKGYCHRRGSQETEDAIHFGNS